MKKLFRHKRTWIILIFILIAAPVAYGYVMMNEFIWSEKEINDYFKNKTMQPQYHTYEAGGRQIFYASIGADSLPMILFIHGSPGSWTDYLKYFGDTQLTAHAHLVAPDRPGYGNSGAGKYVTSIEEQAALLRPLLALNRSKEGVVLVGHSYGGPVAAQMAIDAPDQIKALVLLAPQIDPDHEKQFAINKLAGAGWVRSLMPKMFLSAYWEKQTHVSELLKMKDEWGQLTLPTIYMFGDRDQIVPPENAQFAKKEITHAPLEMIEFPKENHFIPWTQRDSVTRVLLRLIASNTN